MVKERPILFSGPMVLAILAGRKTMTRRMVRPQPAGAWAAPGKTTCPYGKPGDRLWVREAWRTAVATDSRPGGEQEHELWPLWYEADGTVRFRGAMDGGPGFMTSGRLRHARFMPRWASRITLEVTAVRAERLQAITEADAIAEGAPYTSPAAADTANRWWFRTLWDSINSARGLGWGANPWVWVVEFRRAAP